MSRPKSKDELMKASNEQYKKLLDLIDSMSEEVRANNFKFEDSPDKLGAKFCLDSLSKRQ